MCANLITINIPTFDSICIFLGIVIKCHESRSLSENRKIARSILLTKLDNLINNESSIESQIKKKERKKMVEKNRRRNKLQDLKDEWKERENIK